MSVGRAPGKLVLSGSYSVLWGAPALVAAVDRFAFADAGRPAVHVAEEVAAAVDLGLVERPCFVDASALRETLAGGGSRKLGLGSSAAILLATLVAFRGAPADAAARRALFDDALRAHRKAQGGGSGVDVAASTFGGILRFSLTGGAPDISPQALPAGTATAVFACGAPASTSSFVARVRALEASEPSRFSSLMGRAAEGAERAAAAASPSDLVCALADQAAALAELGEAAGVPIVTPAVAAAARVAAREGGAFVASGAGGGDVAIFVGAAPPSPGLVHAAAEGGMAPLDAALGAEGAARVPEVPASVAEERA